MIFKHKDFYDDNNINYAWMWLIEEQSRLKYLAYCNDLKQKCFCKY